MRTIAGAISASVMLLLIGYSIGYFVCLWRYNIVQRSPERRPIDGRMPVVDVPDDWDPPDIRPPSVGEVGMY